MITHDQSERLKKAGWKGTIIIINQSAKDSGFTCSPDEKDLMEFVGNSGACVIIRCKDCWTINVGERCRHSTHKDLTEVLVQAVEKILKGEIK